MKRSAGGAISAADARSNFGSANKPSAIAGSSARPWPARAALNTASNGLAPSRLPKLGGASGDSIGAFPPTAGEGPDAGRASAQARLAASAIATAPMPCSRSARQFPRRDALIVRSAIRRVASPIRSVPSRQTSFRSKSAEASPALCRSVAKHVIGDSDLLHLAVERGAPDAELARHLRHLSAIV